MTEHDERVAELEAQIGAQNEQIKLYADLLELQKTEIQLARAQAESLATTDGLTGLANHGAFQRRLAEDFQRASRYQTALSVLIVNIERFGEYNEAYGYVDGDTVLKQLAAILVSHARDTDFVARYGGGAFGVLLPLTDRVGAETIAGRISAAIRTSEWPFRPIIARVNIASIGVGVPDPAALLAAACQAPPHRAERGSPP